MLLWVLDTKPLLEPKELRSLTLKISENPDSGQHDLLILCRFCMNEAPHSYVELFSNTADAKEIRKISDIVLLKKVIKNCCNQFSKII